jgi:hypothetical protein
LPLTIARQAPPPASPLDAHRFDLDLDPFARFRELLLVLHERAERLHGLEFVAEHTDRPLDE